LFGIGVKTEIAGIMHQKHEVKIGCSLIVQVESLNGMKQKIEQYRIGLFFPERFVENFGNEHGNATFYRVERDALKRTIHLDIRYPLHLSVDAVMQIGFYQMQRLKQSNVYRRFFAVRSLYKNYLPAHVFCVQMNNQAGVAITKMVQNNRACGGYQGDDF